MVKSFLHSEGHPEKFTELHGEEKKEEGVRGDPNVQLAHLLRQMLTVQNPKKSQLAKKPACSLVDNVSQGLRLPPSVSGCLSPEGDGLQLAISVQSFVPCAGLVVS